MFDRRLLSNFDWTLLLLAVGLSLLGVLSIYSASKGYPGNPQYWLRQLYWIVIGLGLGALILLVDFRTIGSWSYFLHGGVVTSLVVLLLVGSGRQVDRWFQVGPVTVQPSEFAKFSTILAIAYYLRDGRRVGDLGLRGLIVPTLLMGVPFALIVNQPDLGTALLLPAIFIPMIVQAGLRWRLLLIASGLVLLSIVALVLSFQLGYYQVDKKLVANLQRQGYSGEQLAAVERLKGQRFYFFDPMRGKLLTSLELFGEEKLIQQVEEQSFRPYISSLLRPYQQRRLITFLDPERDPLGDGYHVIQSRVAVGSGGFTGKGFGSSTQGSLNFLPARHTDFIFSIFAEEWGFLGAIVLFSLYGYFIYRGISIVFETHDRFSAFVAVGIVSIISFQLVINTGMAVGLLPVVGVPLPFFSYGGSSMITMMTGVAILLNIRMRRFMWG